MAQQKYRFVRESDGRAVWVSFEKMMTKDIAGFIDLPDGTRARHDHSDVCFRKSRRERVGNVQTPPSDSLGFTVNQLPEFEEDRVRNGFRDVEFVQDPHVPEFCQVKFSSEGARRRYMRHRGFFDKSSTVGCAVSADILAGAMEIVARKGE